MTDMPTLANAWRWKQICVVAHGCACLHGASVAPRVGPLEVFEGDGVFFFFLGKWHWKKCQHARSAVGRERKSK